MKVIAKVGKERIEIWPMPGEEFGGLAPRLKGIPVFYNAADPTQLWPQPSDYVSIIREDE